MNAPLDDFGAIEPPDAHSAPGRPGPSASPEKRSSRIGAVAPSPGCGRRRTGQPVSALLKKSQAERLDLIGVRNRIMAADDGRNLLLERLGLIARIGPARPHRLRGVDVIEWTITAAGIAALQAIRSTNCLSVRFARKGDHSAFDQVRS